MIWDWMFRISDYVEFGLDLKDFLWNSEILDWALGDFLWICMNLDWMLEISAGFV